MNRIAIFGGTFNPIHKGHINLCLECNEYFNFDKILLIPTNIPPHKQVKELATNYQRLKMCKLAIKNMPLFEVNDIEMRLSGISYTINTIKEIQNTYPDSQLYLIIGSDMLFMFNRWYQYKEILNRVILIVGARQENEYQKMINYVKTELNDNKNVKIIKIKTVEISSTQIRNELKNKENPSLLDSRVYEYIVKNNIYIS